MWNMKNNHRPALPKLQKKGFYCIRLLLPIVLLCAVILASTVNPWKYTFPATQETGRRRIYSIRNSDIDKSPSSSSPTELEHLYFGIAAAADSIGERIEYAKLWWEEGKTRGNVWVDRELNDTEAELASKNWSFIPTRVSQDASMFPFTHPNGPPSAVRVARILLESFDLHLPDVRWFVMGDDDTFFFIENLVQVLRKYDHNQFYYIGCNSESNDQNDYHSYHMAYGGGGFAISYPLAKALVGSLDACLYKYHYVYGSDHRIQSCLSEFGVPLTKELGFHQFDVKGSFFGMLAAHPQVPTISFHHLDTAKPIFPNKTRVQSLAHLMKAIKVDAGRVLQQSICYDTTQNWTLSISWGYSVQVYERLEMPTNLERPLLTFVTWGNPGRNSFTFNTRIVPSDPCLRPTVYFMENIDRDAVLEEVVLSYTLQVPSSLKDICPSNVGASLKEIIVFSRDTPLDWKKSPRRECCDVLSTRKDSIELFLRECGPNESILDSTL